MVRASDFPARSPLATNAQVYRGSSRGVLPEEFWKPNDYNVRGGVELGFMSTTLKRSVRSDVIAIVYEACRGSCCVRP